MGSLYPHDNIVTDLDQPVIAPNACLGCLSKSIFKTTGRGPSIYVCGNCYSTDVEYGVVSDTLQKAPYFPDTSLNTSMPTLKMDPSPTLSDCELNLDEWIFTEDSCSALSLEDTGNLYGDVDELFEF